MATQRNPIYDPNAPATNGNVADNRNRLGRYEIVREIARSNDIVYEARDPRINRRVALKELNMDASLGAAGQRDRIERFYREARAAGKLTHPNIVTILDVSEYNGRHYIAMEYLEGETLRRRINTVGSGLPLHQVILIGVALCDALEYAHRHGVVHRDIKPDNVHLLPGFDMAAVGAQSVVKLTDFGIARIAEETNLTIAGQVFGTPSYMSPEQIRGEEIDLRSDLFSLGIMLHECTTGKKPFLGDTIATITHGLMYNPTPPLAGVPVQLDDAIRRAMMKNPGDRFGGAAQFRTALLAALPTRTLSPTGAPLIAPNPLPPGAVISNPQRTMQYGTQTQMGVAPGLNPNGGGGAMTVPQPPPMYIQQVNPSWNPNPQFQPADIPKKYNEADFLPPVDTMAGIRRRAVRVITWSLLVFLLVGLAFGVGALFQRASQTFAQQNAYIKETKLLNDAIRLHNGGEYLKAVQIFEKLRAMKTQSQIAEKATNGALFAYRELGHKAQNANDWGNAIKWYQSALSVKPDDPQARQEYETASRFVNSSRPADSLPPPGPPERTTQFPRQAAPGTPNSNASDFVDSNRQAAQRAAQLLQQGNEAMRQGNKSEALRLWNQAVEEGTGSQAATEALQRIGEQTGGSSPF